MTRKQQHSNLDKNKRAKRILKPVVEKKRRDRINQSLCELRTLLLNYTSDIRLENPKIEKAEILDLAVEYLQKWTDRPSTSNDSTDDNSGQVKVHCVPMDLPHSSDSSAPTLFSIHNAGFQQCMAQLAGYVHKITPAQRMGLIQELKNHMDSQHPNNARTGQASSSSTVDFHLRMNEAEASIRLDAALANEVFCNSKEDISKLTLLSHHNFSSPPGSHSYSMACHDYLSPPPSPYLSCSPTYTTPPPFPTLHFSFPPSLSPLPSNTSFSYSHSLAPPTIPAPVSFSPTLPLSSTPTLHFPSLTPLRSPVPATRDRLPAYSSPSMWRPWF